MSDKEYLKIGALRIKKEKILFFFVDITGRITLTLEKFPYKIIMVSEPIKQSQSTHDICAPYDITVKLPIALFEELRIYLNAESDRLDGDNEI